MEYDVRMEWNGRVELAVVRRHASPRDLGRVVPEACGTVWGVVRSQQIEGAGRHVAVYLDGEGNVEVGVELPSPFAGHGEVVGSSLPEGLVATTTHLGPYDRLHQAHAAIRRWCAAHGHEPSGLSWEVYGHWQDDWGGDPARIRTDVFYRLLPSAGSAPLVPTG